MGEIINKITFAVTSLMLTNLLLMLWFLSN